MVETWKIHYLRHIRSTRDNKTNKSMNENKCIFKTIWLCVICLCVCRRTKTEWIRDGQRNCATILWKLYVSRHWMCCFVLISNEISWSNWFEFIYDGWLCVMHLWYIFGFIPIEIMSCRWCVWNSNDNPKKFMFI